MFEFKNPLFALTKLCNLKFINWNFNYAATYNMNSIKEKTIQHKQIHDSVQILW
jgi:hypothetical protein